MNKAEKVEVVHSLSETLKKAKGLVLAEYRGLKVLEINEIRREVKKNHGDLKVVKNRLAKKAIEGTTWAPLEKYLRGPLAIVYSEQDPVVLTKVLTKFASSFEALKLTAASLGADVIDRKGIEVLSTLPSKEELYAKLLGTLQAPASGLVRTLQGVPQKLAIALKAIAEQKQS